MNDKAGRKKPSTSRREFITRSSGGLAAAALAGTAVPRVHAAENNTIKLALVGCGGRGTGAAANALSTEGPTKLVAMADVFEQRLNSSYERLSKQFPDQVDVPPERRFLGMDAFKKAIDVLEGSDVVMLTTPPAFRPIHLEYAVSKNRNVFMEKSFAVDAPGVRRVLKAGKAALKKDLKIAGGLMCRHNIPLQEAVRQIHDGAIGDIITAWAYREHHEVGCKARLPEMTELQYQIQNYSNFTWVNGSFILDWLIHNLDVCCWIKDAWPVSAQGQGGRQVRDKPDQLFDHYAVEYSFADGTRLFAQGRHMANCWGFFGSVIHGTKGSAVLGEGINNPAIYKTHQQVPANLIWEYDGPRVKPHQTEHDVFFKKIREDQPHNEAERSAHAAMTGILGRMAAESGKTITWEEAMASELVLCPGLDDFTMESDPPVMPDADGNYPVAMPGITKAF